MMLSNAVYAQSGGVTSVINAQAFGVIKNSILSKKIGKIFASYNGIIGVLENNLIDLSNIDMNVLYGLMHTPAGAFGSCRYKVKDDKEIKKILDIFKMNNITYFFYNGGGDSQDTSNRINKISKEMNYPLKCIGIPKTIDNDLPCTDNSPGFGSVAKYVSISTLEANFDISSMCFNSTKIFIMEVMGRHTGWISASSGLSNPHIILFPEIPFNQTKFLQKVKLTVNKFGYCVIIVAEGIRKYNGEFLSTNSNNDSIISKDAFGHIQLGGVSKKLAELIQNNLKFKAHWAVCDYLQRSARHIASQTDLKQAYATGKAAVEFAVAGKTGIMPIIVRKSNHPYQWNIDYVDLESVANVEKKMPRDFITQDGWGITNKCREYLIPLIQGEAYPPYKNGLPIYINFKNLLSK